MTARLDGRLVVLGCGGVARCLLQLLLGERLVDPRQLTVIDQRDVGDAIAEVLAAGATFTRQLLTPDNYAAILAARLRPGDVLCDLTLDVDTIDELAWCQAHGVRFLNASIERWPSGPDQPLYQDLQDLNRQTAAWRAGGPTAVVDHGACPGLASHLVKAALLDLAAALLATPDAQLRVPLSPAQRDQLQAALADCDWARLAQAAGVQVVHVADLDTQISSQPKPTGVFANTWSAAGLHWEATAPAELAWGTHEATLPPGADLAGDAAGRVVQLATRGMHTPVRSWVPDGGEFGGMVICHEETFTIADLLTVRDGDQPAARPTVLFAYRPAALARASLRESADRHGYALQPRQHLLTDELVRGADQLGALLLTPHLGWWTGSQLDIHETRRLLGGGGHNATVLQTAAPLMAGLVWLLDHPDQGVCLPEDLDHTQVLDVAGPYLGPCPSVPTDWTPTTDPAALSFGAFGGRHRQPSRAAYGGIATR